MARPFLPRHFPGYEMYFWLDADAWLQDWRVVELYCAAAGTRQAGDHARDRPRLQAPLQAAEAVRLDLAWKNYREAFGWRVADRLGRNPMVNGGVFALHRDAPHWDGVARG